MRGVLRQKPLPDVSMPTKPIEKVLQGQKALVTGADSGIGKGIAIALGHAGADVVVNYHKGADKAAEVVEEVKKTGSKNVYAHQADVSQEDQVIDMFAKMKSEFGAVDILVSNAGLQADAPLEEMTLAKWNLVLSVNLTGQFLCCREAVKIFKEQGVRKEVSCAAGKIICMSSVHQEIPWAGHVNYASSKGAIKLMMESIAQEVAPHRIRVNSVAPGAIRTPINKDAWDTPEAYDKLMELIPYNRIGEPDDIGKAAVWLASDDSDYVIGTTIFVDGGMTLYAGFTTNG